MTIRRTLLAALAAAATIVVAPAAASASSTDPYDPYDTPYETCEYDPSIAADSPDCFPPCEYDPSIAADAENCAPCLDPYSPYCEEPTTTTTTTVPPTTTTTTEVTILPPTTSTTTSTTTTTTMAPTTTTTTDPADPAVAQAGRVQPQVSPAQQGPTLPATGSNQTLYTALFALAFVAGGGAILTATRRKQHG